MAVAKAALAAVAVAVLVVVGTESVALDGGEGGAGTAPVDDGREARTGGTLVPAGQAAGARIRLAPEEGEPGTRRAPGASGLRTAHGLGVPVHISPCGTRSEPPGPHYQRVEGPVRPSVDPREEVGRDFTADPRGAGWAEALQGWKSRPGEARSRVPHRRATHSGPGGVGQAGERVACLTVPFTPFPGPTGDRMASLRSPRTS
ncbi:superoxide dismutase family protein [Streptomyces sp. NPDC005438]|uniref:superoxide dismutase family protein n=1 Tax=Streptomyces sp. NPDC005438 TaxID=3156880 RepID=UPI0033A47D3E